jgi:hypothetical protein
MPAVRNSYDSAGRLVRVEEGSLSAWQPDTVAPALWPGFAVHRFVDTSYDALDRKTREAVSGVGPAGAAPGASPNTATTSPAASNARRCA